MSDSPNFDSHTLAIYPSHTKVEEAIQLLGKNGIDVTHLSVIGQDYHTEEHPVGFVNAGDRMLAWGKFGAFWGGLWGLLIGSAMVFVPGVGAVMFAGWIVSMLGGAVFGGAAAALGGALASIGVPNDTVVKYETAIKAGNFVLIVHGDAAEVAKAEQVLTSTGHQGIETIAAPVATAS